LLSFTWNSVIILSTLQTIKIKYVCVYCCILCGPHVDALG
jgi:hypothetical protein